MTDPPMSDLGLGAVSGLAAAIALDVVDLS